MTDTPPHRSTSRGRLPAALLVLSIAACGSGSNPSDDLADALSSISDAGASRVHALVIDEGEMITATAGREADVGEPALEMYEIGASTEPLTATVVLQLVDEGRLDLDAPVAESLPDVVARLPGREVTVRQLLQHTSGINDDETTGSPTDQPAPWRPAAINYEIARLLIESLTSRSWTTEVESRILEPLALTHTTLPTDANLPWSHVGTALTTPRDLSRFYQALLGGELLPPALLAEMQGTIPTGETDIGYGLGLVKRTLSCDRITWGHHSTTSGYRSEAALTTARYGIIVSNATVDGDSQAIDAQRSATNDVIDGALC